MGEVIMTEAEVQRGLRLVRYGGVVITVTVFVALLAFALVTGNALGASGLTLNSLLPYILVITVLAAILSVALYFGYRAYLMGKLKR
jgi:hypothetical protein